MNNINKNKKLISLFHLSAFGGRGDARRERGFDIYSINMIYFVVL